MVFQWKYQWHTGGNQRSNLVVLPLFSTEITVEITGITTGLPLKSTGLPVVIPLNFTPGIPLKSTGIPVEIPQNFTAGITLKYHWKTNGITNGNQW